jgi:hypothetical protein
MYNVPFFKSFDIPCDMWFVFDSVYLQDVSSASVTRAEMVFIGSKFCCKIKKIVGKRDILRGYLIKNPNFKNWD